MTGYLGLHSAATTVHRPFNWVVADEDARDALVVTAADVYRIALQLDDGSVWILTDDSPVTWQELAGGGGGGATIHTSAYGSPPGSPAAGDLWLPSDSYYLLRYSGSAWVPFGPIFPATDPTTPSWAWVNQGSATISSANGGLHLLAPANLGAGWRIRKIATPATPWTRSTGFLSQLSTEGGVQACGMVVRESSSGKLINLALIDTGTSLVLEINKFSDPTTSDGVLYTERAPRDLRFFRITDNGTNRIYYWSADGAHWQQIYSEGRTTYLTANEVGIEVYNASTLEDCGITAFSWG